MVHSVDLMPVKSRCVNISPEFCLCFLTARPSLRPCPAASLSRLSRCGADWDGVPLGVGGGQDCRSSVLRLGTEKGRAEERGGGGGECGTNWSGPLAVLRETEFGKWASAALGGGWKGDIAVTQ